MFVLFHPVGSWLAVLKTLKLGKKINAVIIKVLCIVNRHERQRAMQPVNFIRERPVLLFSVFIHCSECSKLVFISHCLIIHIFHDGKEDKYFQMTFLHAIPFLFQTHFRLNNHSPTTAEVMTTFWQMLWEPDYIFSVNLPVPLMKMRRMTQAAMMGVARTIRPTCDVSHMTCLQKTVISFPSETFRITCCCDNASILCSF